MGYLTDRTTDELVDLLARSHVKQQDGYQGMYYVGGHLSTMAVEELLARRDRPTGLKLAAALADEARDYERRKRADQSAT